MMTGDKEYVHQSLYLKATMDTDKYRHHFINLYSLTTLHQLLSLFNN